MSPRTGFFGKFKVVEITSPTLGEGTLTPDGVCGVLLCLCVCSAGGVGGGVGFGGV
jgi:hypothetical protein